MNGKIYLSLMFFCFSTSITPGPNNLMIMLSGLNYGIKRSLPHYYGICCGFSLMLLIVGFGFAEIFSAYSMLSSSIKALGLAYLVYLTYKITFSSTQPKVDKAEAPFSFTQALLFQWVNPKTWMMTTGVFATFSLPHVNMYKQALQITLIFGLIAAPCIAVWLVGGVILNPLLNKQKYVRLFNLVVAAFLTLSIMLMLF